MQYLVVQHLRHLLKLNIKSQFNLINQKLKKLPWTFETASFRSKTRKTNVFWVFVLKMVPDFGDEFCNMYIIKGMGINFNNQSSNASGVIFFRINYAFHLIYSYQHAGAYFFYNSNDWVPIIIDISGSTD
jgi:hypothetical protein